MGAGGRVDVACIDIAGRACSGIGFHSVDVGVAPLGVCQEGTVVDEHNIALVVAALYVGPVGGKPLVAVQ